MMMPSTMILTICISMMLKRRHRGLSLDIGSRLAGSGLGGGSKPTPQRKIFSHQYGGHLQTVRRGGG